MEQEPKESLTLEKKNPSDPEEEPAESLKIELGDIIEITAPSNREIDQQVWAITYVDETTLRMIHTSNFQAHTLTFDESGGFTDETIQQIAVLCRCKEKGYARQNALYTGTWIDIHFGGEIPAVISGEITNLEEDMIELTTFPERKIIYIDFGYRGLPEDLLIERIVLRDRPESLGKIATIRPRTEGDEAPEGTEIEEAFMEYTDTGEATLHIPEGAQPKPTTREELLGLYIETDKIIEEEMEEIVQVVEVPESERRYTLDAQLIDFSDELLSQIPVLERTTRVFQKIQNLLHKFKQLREQFSVIDENGVVVGTRRTGAFHKPIVYRLYDLDTMFRWVMPVVRLRKQLHRGPSPYSMDDIQQRDVENISTAEFLQRLSNPSPADSYERKIESLDRELTDYAPPADYAGILHRERPVKTPIECIVKNTPGFFSTTIRNGDEGRTRFVLRRFSVGSTKLVSEEIRGGKGLHRKYSRETLTPEETVNIESLLVFPESFIRYSRVGNPGTALMDKIWLSTIPFDTFRALKKRTRISTTTIADVSRESEYTALTETPELAENESAFLGNSTTIKEYAVDAETRIGETTFVQFLNAIFPKKRMLLEFAKHSIQGNLSISDMIRCVEPFGMYSTDITFSQYKEMRYFVKESVKTRKAECKKRESEFALLRTDYGFEWAGNGVERTFQTMEELAIPFRKSYVVQATSAKKEETKPVSFYSPHETLAHIYATDGGKLYLRLVQKMLLSLITPDKLLDSVQPGKLDDMTNMENIRAAKQCSQRFIVKKYASLEALRKDNQTDDVFYDSEYDDTPYDLLSKYKEKKRDMLPELFFEFFRQVLVDKHDCPESLSTELAETILAGKKRVKEGYALLELRPTLPASVDETALSDKDREQIRLESESRKRMQYYKRVNEHWVRDESVDETSFIDNNTLLCNMQRECIQTTPSQVCAPNSTAAMRMKLATVKRMQNEFDSRYSMSVEEIERDVDRDIRILETALSRKTILSAVLDRKYNDYAVSLGKRAVQIENIESPYEPLRKRIMAQTDFVKKQMDILRFVENYAREPAVDKGEQMHWWYCIETNTKLFPHSLYVLARAFVNTNTYSETLDRLCSELGEKSADGDCIIDKYTDCVLRRIDFASEEGFDEAGFRIVTHQVMERDFGDAIRDALDAPEKIFDSEEKQHAYRIFSTLSGHIGIREEVVVVGEIEDFVLRTTLELMNQTEIVLSEKSYLKRAEKKAKDAKDKPIIPYSIYRHQLLFMCVASTTAIALMTAMPSFRTQKTFPGCVQSFHGYPVDSGEENTAGLKYIACILFRSKSSIAPWNAIEPWSMNTLLKRMKDFVKEKLVGRPDIAQMCQRKREYLALHPEEDIPASLNVAKWVHFMPPLVEYTLGKTLQGIAADFETELLQSIRDGHRSQFGSIGVIKSKTLKHVYGMIELIREIVGKKELLLTTSTKEPFMENACCNEQSSGKSMDWRKVLPLSYFIEENAVIGNLWKRAEDMAGIVRRIQLLSKPSIWFHSDNTTIQRGTPRMERDETTIYGAVIHYCNFDRDLPIPRELEGIVNEKPAVYDRNDSLEVKIEKLKAHGKRFTPAHFEQLMSIVNRQNRVATAETPCKHVSPVEIFGDILTELELHDSEILESPLRLLLRKVLDAYVPNRMVNEERESNVKLNQYLNQTNRRMYAKITEFLNVHGNLSDSHYNQIQVFLHEICQWKFDAETDATVGAAAMGRIHRFVAQSVESMVKIIPSMLQNRPAVSRVRPSWGLDSLHAGEINARLSAQLASLFVFSDHESTQRLLQRIQTQLGSLVLFVKHIPVLLPIVKEGVEYYSLFSKETVYLLLKYSWYSVLYEYIMGTDDPDIVAIDKREIRQRRREWAKERPRVGFAEREGAEGENPLAEIELDLGNIQEGKDRVGAFLVHILQQEMASKHAVNMGYDDIVFKTQRKREKEKNQITSAFEQMERTERKVEDMLKQFKIGRWNIGTQKGLFTYSGETFARQKQLNEYLNADDDDAGGIVLVPPGGISEPDQEEMDVDELANREAVEIEREYEAEANDIDGLEEDYQDGNYYEEDREEEW